jgi:sugar phosphate isomerase/epimerase
MQFGFFTEILADRPIAEIARFAVAAGFTTLEIDVVGHIGDLSRAPAVVEKVRREGSDVCALTCGATTTLLSADRAAQDLARTRARDAVDAALATGVEVVVTFPGRDDTLSEDDNYRALADCYADLAERAARGNVKVVLENWPGTHVNYLATTPAGWQRLFELVPAPHLGLNFDPSHLIWQGIDPEQALRPVADRVFLTHAKDTEIFAVQLQQVGFYGRDWWTYRLPGHGRLDWSRWLALLRGAGFDGVVSVEHEDPTWGYPGGPFDRRQEGLREGLRILKAASR